MHHLEARLASVGCQTLPRRRCIYQLEAGIENFGRLAASDWFTLRFAA